jgi:(4S)-4-hydroxy-5-phosphonooxypentane-2,3-dione isomerase
MLHSKAIPGTRTNHCRMKNTFAQRTIIFVLASLLWSLHLESCAAMMLVSPSTAQVGPFALNVQVHVKPDRREEFLEVILYDAQETMRQEKGAVQFTLGQSTTDDAIFHFHEQYQTLKDFEDHQATEHFQKWKAFCDTNPFVSDLICQEFYLFPPSFDYAPKGVPSGEVFCLNVELCIKESVREEFLSVIRNNQKGSLTTEALCRQYDYGESTTTPNSFYFHEQYLGKERGQEGLLAHQGSAHFQLWEEFAAPNPFTKDPVVSLFHSIFNEAK